MKHHCYKSSQCRCANDLTAAPKEVGFAILVGECLQSRSVAIVFDIAVPRSSLPHPKNFFLQFLLGSACEVGVLQVILISMWPAVCLSDRIGPAEPIYVGSR